MEGFKPQLEGAIRNAHKDIATDTPEAIDREKIERIVGPDAWNEILTTQEEKQALVREYREWRKKSWSTEGEHSQDRSDSLDRITKFENGENGRTLCLREDGGYEAVGKGAERHILTKGEVMAAHEWGVWWKFDPSVPREQQLTIMSTQVRDKLAVKYDDQLIAFGSHDRLSDDRKRDAYVGMKVSQQSLDTMPDGILAEKMLMSFLTKEMHDGDYSFTVERTDAYDDIEHKIDFVITVADRRRGVQVNEPEHRVGIQFTLNSGKRSLKEEQLSRAGKRLHETDVDELILVTLPIDDIRTHYTRWRYDESGTVKSLKRLDPRGPDHFWSENLKQQILDALVRVAH